jgi:hypothetical protein
MYTESTKIKEKKKKGNFLEDISLTYLLTGGGRHPGGSATPVVAATGCRHKHGLHAFLEGALLAVDYVAHQNVDQGVLHQRHENEDGAARHEHVNRLDILYESTRKFLESHSAQRKQINNKTKKY